MPYFDPSTGRVVPGNTSPGQGWIPLQEDEDGQFYVVEGNNWRPIREFGADNRTIRLQLRDWNNTLNNFLGEMGLGYRDAVGDARDLGQRVREMAMQGQSFDQLRAYVNQVRSGQTANPAGSQAYSTAPHNAGTPTPNIGGLPAPPPLAGAEYGMPGSDSRIGEAQGAVDVPPPPISPIIEQRNQEGSIGDAPIAPRMPRIMGSGEDLPAPPPMGRPSLADWRNMTIPQLKATFTPQELAQLDREALEQFSNEDLLQIASSTNSPSEFLLGFREERLQQFPQDVIAPLRGNLPSGTVESSAVTTPTTIGGVTYTPRTRAGGSGASSITGPDVGAANNGVVKTDVINPTYPGGPDGPAPRDVFPDGDAANLPPGSRYDPTQKKVITPPPLTTTATTNTPSTPAPPPLRGNYGIPTVSGLYGGGGAGRGALDNFMAFLPRELGDAVTGGYRTLPAPPPLTGAMEPMVEPRRRLSDAPNPYPYAGGFTETDVPGRDTTGLRKNDHTGRDYAFPANTPVPVAKPGRVIYAGNAGDFGKTVVVAHEDGTQTQYSHLSDAGVKVGETVGKGQPVGVSGATGVGTDEHLHFEENPIGSGIGYNSTTGKSAYPITPTGLPNTGTGGMSGSVPPGANPAMPNTTDPNETPPPGWAVSMRPDGPYWVNINQKDGTYTFNPRTNKLELPTGGWVDHDIRPKQTVPQLTTIDLGNGKIDKGYWADGKWHSIGESRAGMTPEEIARLDISRGNLAVSQGQLALQIKDAEEKLALAKSKQDWEQVSYWQDRADKLEQQRINQEVAIAGLTGQYGGNPTLDASKWEYSKQKDVRDFENAEAWRRENANEEKRRFDVGASGYIEGAPTLEREKLISDAERANLKTLADLGNTAAQIRLREIDQLETALQNERRFGLEQGALTGFYDGKNTLDRDRFGLQAEVQRGQLGLDRDRFGLETRKTEWEMAKDPFSATVKARMLRGELPAPPPMTTDSTGRYEVIGEPVHRIMSAPPPMAGEPVHRIMPMPPTMSGKPGAITQLKPPPLAGARTMQPPPISEYEGMAPGLRAAFEGKPIAAPKTPLPPLSGQDRARLLPSEKRILDAEHLSRGINPDDADEIARRLTDTAQPAMTRRTVRREPVAASAY